MFATADADNFPAAAAASNWVSAVFVVLIRVLLRQIENQERGATSCFRFPILQ